MNKQSANADKASQSSQAPQASQVSSRAPGAESIAESVQSLVDQGAETIDTIKARVAEATNGAKTTAARLVDRTSELVTEYPLRSLAAAFGIGYVAMRITTSKITSLAMLGGVIYAGTQLFRR